MPRTRNSRAEANQKENSAKFPCCAPALGHVFAVDPHLLSGLGGTRRSQMNWMINFIITIMKKMKKIAFFLPPFDKIRASLRDEPSILRWALSRITMRSSLLGWFSLLRKNGNLMLK